jgi:16S rRNA processing protein RimM
LLEIGRVSRPHGLQGEVGVELWTDVRDRLAPGTTLHTDGGPLTVAHSRPHGRQFLVRFENVEDRSAAERLRGTVLSAEPLVIAGVLWVHELIGATVVLPEGRSIGVVEAVQANPASDLLVLEGGVLVPLCFVVAHEPGAAGGPTVTVDVPEGLLDL